MPTSDSGGPRDRPISLRLNFGWAFLGNVVFQACQWLMLVILAKTTSVETVGNFGLAVAICTPVSILAGLSLAGVQVTDARDEYQFGHYLAVRLLSAAASIAVILTIALISNYSSETKNLIVLVGLGQIILIIREVYLTCLQKHERMDLVAGSNILQGLLSLMTFGLLLRLTGSLLAGVAGLLGVRLLTWLTWDVRSVARLLGKIQGDNTRIVVRPLWEWSRLAHLIGVAAPLGVTAGLISLNSNLPRYIIERALGKEALGYFTAVMALPAAGVVIIGAAGTSASPRLARYFVSDSRQFSRLLSKLSVMAVLLGLLGLFVVALGGRTILALVFHPPYAHYNGLFLWLMLSASVSYVDSFLGYGMTAARCFLPQIPLFTLVTISTIGFAYWLVPRLGLAGAAIAFLSGAAVQLIGSVVIIRSALSKSEIVVKGTS